MTALGGVFWSIVVIVSACVVFIVVSFVLGYPSVLNWFMDATYSVFYPMAVGVIVMISSSHFVATLINKHRE